MSSLVIHDIDPETEHRLHALAVKNGRSLEQEARLILREAAGAHGPTVRSPEEKRELIARILAMGRRLPEPFDQKAYSDAISDGTE